MRRNVCILAVGAVLALAAAAQAQQVQQYQLRFSPMVGMTDTGTLKAILQDLTYQEMPLGFTGGAQAAYAMCVTAADGQTTDVEFRLTGVAAQFMGQALAAQTPPPMALKLNCQGGLVGIEARGDQRLDLVSGGGIPLQALAAIAAATQFPAEPVACGASWEQQGRYTLPTLGQVELRSVATLESVTGDTVVVKSQIEMLLPEFLAPNPLAPAQQIAFSEGRLLVKDLIRVYDMGRSKVLKVTGAVEMAFIAQFPDVPAPLGAKATFEMVSGELTETPAEGVG